jgi:hypothetical protein
MKICNQCLEEKEFNQFYKRKDNKDGYRNNCKLCHNLITKSGTIKYQQKEESKEKAKIHNKEYWIENKEYLTIKNKEKYYRNRESYLLQKKEYNKLNRDKINLRLRNRYKEDILFNISRCIGSIIGGSFRKNGYSKTSNTFNILGCTFDKFRIYLENKFEPWMNWENRGFYNGELNYGWDIDHFIPLSSAKTEEEIILLNHYTNLQPLCSKINRDIKKDRLDYT